MLALFKVDAEEIRTVLALEVPPHPETTFDDVVMVALIAHSRSVTLAEKIEMVGSFGRWTQGQADGLIRVLTAERDAFDKLNGKHAARLAVTSAGDGTSELHSFQSREETMKLDILAWHGGAHDLYFVLDPSKPEFYQPACHYVAHSQDEAEYYVACMVSCPLCDGDPCRNEGRCARELAADEEERLCKLSAEHDIETLGAGWLDRVLKE